MRYFLKFSYNGAPYCGWQRQPNAISVQQVIEEAISKVLRFNVSITGAGRTDAGVHAHCMYAHFDLPEAINDTTVLLRSLNHLCGSNIAFTGLIAVPPQAHARFDATERTYKYFVTEYKSPFLYNLAWHSHYHLDYVRMNDAANLLLNTDDFTSFAKLHSDTKTNICKVMKAAWNDAGDLHVFTITADRFLRNMVRAIVGTLIDVGRGKVSVQEFQDIIMKQDRCAAGISMPAHALYLWDVKYPYL